MSRWIDVPAKRIFEIDAEIFRNDFRALNANGEPVGYGEQTYLAIRKRDDKVFRLAEFIPRDPGPMNYFYLEEL